MITKNKLNGAMKSKTIWVNIISIGIGAVIVNMPLIQQHIDPIIYGYMFMTLSTINAMLRFVTTIPLEDK